MTAGAVRPRTCRPSPREVTLEKAKTSSRATIRPTSPSTARSIPIGAASMAASTASRGRRTPIWACRPGSISRRKLFVKDGAAELLERELVGAGLPAAHHRDRHQHRPLPADRDASTASCARMLEVLARANHPVGIVTKSALVTRDIDILGPMAERGPRQSGALGHDARPQARALDGAARRDAGQAPSRRSASCREAGIPDHRHGRADHSGGERPGDRAHPGRRAHAAGAREAGYVHAAPAARGRAICSANGCSSIARTSCATSSRWCARCAAARTTMPTGAERHDRRRPLCAWMIGRRFEIAARAARPQRRDSASCAPTCSRAPREPASNSSLF